MFKWLLAVILFPIIEIIGIVFAVKNFGGWWILGGLAFSALLGFFIINMQGQDIISRAREDILNGNSFIASVWDRIMLCLVGALFLFPGFISDTIAVTLLIPPVREFAIDKIVSKFKAGAGRMKNSSFFYFKSSATGFGSESYSGNDFTQNASTGKSRIFDCEVIETDAISDGRDGGDGD